MIVDYTVENWKRFLWEAMDRMEKTRFDLTNIVAWLRDTNVDIWTESPSDPDKLTAGRAHYPLEGWRSFFKRLHADVLLFNNAHGTKVANYDAAAKAALDGFLASFPAMASAFNTTMTNYRDQFGNTIQRLVAQADRDALATAIEAQFQ